MNQAGAAATAAPARTRRRPARPPRRVSGPARRPQTQPSRTARPGVGVRLELLASGRRWIAALAVGLIGIVLLQLVHLELTHGSGVAIEREETLERQNAALSIEDSERSSGQHVAAAAQALGMVIVPNGALHILSGRGALHARRAVDALSAPAPATPPPAAVETSTTQTAGEAGQAGGAEAPPATETQSAQSTPTSGATTVETPTAPTSTAAPATEQAAPGGGATAPAG